MKKDPAMWSRRFARDVARELGIGDEAMADSRVDSLIGELTEQFRYLPLRQVNLTQRYARFLRAGQSEDRGSPPTLDSAVAALDEACELARFQRTRHGYSQPADENDEWSDEDRRDFANAAWERLDREDPWKGGPDVQAG